MLLRVHSKARKATNYQGDQEGKSCQEEIGEREKAS